MRKKGLCFKLVLLHKEIHDVAFLLYFKTFFTLNLHLKITKYAFYIKKKIYIHSYMEFYLKLAVFLGIFGHTDSAHIIYHPLFISNYINKYTIYIKSTTDWNYFFYSYVERKIYKTDITKC